jgi:hypothetical protein
MKRMFLGIAGAIVVGTVTGCVAGRMSNTPVGPVVKEATAQASVINTLGKHALFANERTSFSADVYTQASDLLYTVSVQNADKRRVNTLANGPWPLRHGWFMVVEGPSLWVFDGDKAVRVVKLTYVDQTPGLDERTAKEFPEIMKNAPKAFLDRLPPTVPR